MKDLAVGVAFKLNKKDRQRVLPYESRLALEAIVEVIHAFNGEANRKKCDMAVAIYLNKSRNKARDVISRPQANGFVDFENKASGSCVNIPITTQDSFELFEELEVKINWVTRIEDKGYDVDVTKIIEELKLAGVYQHETDDELDEIMKKTIDRALGEE